VKVFFESDKNYVLLSSPDFRVVIHVSGSKARQYITSIGVTSGEHRLLATDTEYEPTFYLDGEKIVDTAVIPLGEISLFFPQGVKLRGALAKESRYLTTGLKIGNFAEIVGGIRPGFGVFFNVQVFNKHPDFTGMISSSLTRLRDNSVSDFETPNLFD
jgi:hypothetical protein